MNFTFSAASDAAVMRIIAHIERLVGEMKSDDSALVADLIRYAIEDAVREEREACSDVCRSLGREYDADPGECAAAIRARSEVKP